VGRESAGSASVVIQDALGGGTGPRLSVALHEMRAGARADRHFRPVVLRGGVGGAPPSPDAGKPETAEAAGHETYLAGCAQEIRRFMDCHRRRTRAVPAQWTS